MKNQPIIPKLNPITLPSEGQKVQWQTYDDFNKKHWKTGTYCTTENQFNSGFGKTTSQWDSAYNVIWWKPYQSKLSLWKRFLLLFINQD